MENKGVIFSAAGHVGLILWIVLGDMLFSPDDAPPPTVTNVSLMTSAQFDAMAAAAPSTPEPALTPDEAPAAEPTPAEQTPPEAQPSEVTPPDPVQVDEAVPEADTPQPLDTPQPVAPPADTEQPVAVVPSSIRPRPRPSKRVAETPVEPPPEDVKTAETAQAAASADAAPDAPVIEEPAKVETVEQEAATQIVTETEPPKEDAPTLAPTASLRPKSRPKKPAPTEQPVETQTAAAETPVEKPVKKPAKPAKPATDDAVAEALAAELAGGAATGGSDAPKGPPLNAGEKNDFRVAVQKFWNVAALSTEALRVTVIVHVEVGPDGTPNPTSIRMMSFSGGSEAAAKQAYEAARRAILRSGSQGFPLPKDKYDQWKEIEITFDPNGVGL